MDVNNAEGSLLVVEVSSPAVTVPSTKRKRDGSSLHFKREEIGTFRIDDNAFELLNREKTAAESKITLDELDQLIQITKNSTNYDGILKFVKKISKIMKLDPKQTWKEQGKYKSWVSVTLLRRF